MNITETQDGDLAIVRLAGRLDVLTSKDLGTRLTQLVDAGTRRIAIDLSGLDYVSSAGLRVLLQVRKALKPMAGTVALCAAGDFVRDVLETTGFTSIFPCHPTVEEAVAQMPRV